MGGPRWQPPPQDEELEARRHERVRPQEAAVEPEAPGCLDDVVVAAASVVVIDDLVRGCHDGVGRAAARRGAEVEEAAEGRFEDAAAEVPGGGGAAHDRGGVVQARDDVEQQIERNLHRRLLRSWRVVAIWTGMYIHDWLLTLPVCPWRDRARVLSRG